MNLLEGCNTTPFYFLILVNIMENNIAIAPKHRDDSDLQERDKGKERKLGRTKHFLLAKYI